MLCDTSDLPIGFGLGKDLNYWTTALSQTPVIRTQIVVTEPEILGIKDIAQLLRCSIDKVRRIPRDMLPARNGPGKENLYLREDVLEYLRNLSGDQRRNSGLSSRAKSTKNTERHRASVPFDIASARAQLDGA